MTLTSRRGLIDYFGLRVCQYLDYRFSYGVPRFFITPLLPGRKQSKQMFMTFNPKYNWARWIAVLPASVGACILAYLVFKFFGLLTAHFGDQDDKPFLMNYSVPALASGFGGYSFVYAGAYVAPVYKKITATILLVISAALAGIGIFVVIALAHPTALITSIIESLAQLIGAFVAFFSKEFKD